MECSTVISIARNVLVVNGIFNKVVCACLVPNHGSEQSSVHY